MNAPTVMLRSLVMLACLGVTSAYANVVTGELWHVPDSVARDAIPVNIPGSTPDVVFDVNSPLNFTAAGPVQTFLNSGGAFNVRENTAGTLASPISNGVTSTLINFTGDVTVTNGQTFTVTHDDGLTLTIGGLPVIDVPGPTGPIQTTVRYTGASGTLPFQLVYGECCAGSAVLQISLPLSNSPVSPAPEPGTLALMGLGIVGVISARRRKARQCPNAC